MNRPFGRHASLDVHQWGPGAFGGGWYATSCERCGHFAIGNACNRRDVLARAWPRVFSCDAVRARRQRRADRYEAREKRREMAR